MPVGDARLENVHFLPLSLHNVLSPRFHVAHRGVRLPPWVIFNLPKLRTPSCQNHGPLSPRRTVVNRIRAQYDRLLPKRETLAGEKRLPSNAVCLPLQTLH